MNTEYRVRYGVPPWDATTEPMHDFDHARTEARRMRDRGLIIIGIESRLVNEWKMESREDS